MPWFAKVILIGVAIWLVVTIISDRIKENLHSDRSGKEKNDNRSIDDMLRDLEQAIDESENKGKRNTGNKYSVSKCSGRFRFYDSALMESDKQYTTAEAIDGVVVYTFPEGHPWTIGYYDCTPDVNGTTFIYDQFDRRKCGKVLSDGSVFLMRTALYERYTANGWPAKPPFPEEKWVASFSCIAEDAETGEAFGFVDGDMRSAAAAFVSLVNECHNHSKYQQFYREYAENH